MSTATKALRQRRVFDLAPFDLVPSDTRVLFTDVSWDVFERIVDSVPEGEHYRIAYDGKDIEMILGIGPFHERQKSRLDLFIAYVASELKIRNEPMGSATWRRKELERGIEPDLSYFFDPIKMAAAVAIEAYSDNISDYPNPDLVAEVDISPPKVDRPGIYARLQIPEFWRVRDRIVSIEHLGPNGQYVPAVRSRFLPVSPEDVTRWVFTEDRSDSVAWGDRLRAWARTIASS